RVDRRLSGNAGATPQSSRGFPRAHPEQTMTTTAKHSATVNAAITTPTDREVRIERIFNATRDRVWQAITDPSLIAQWWGRGNKLVVEKFELVRGGHWRFVEHSDHGVHGFE